MSTKPIIVQSDHSLLVETDSPLYVEARDRLCRFAELVKSPDHMHTYRINALSLWNAASAGMKVSEIKETLSCYSKYSVPSNVLSTIEHLYARYGLIRLLPAPSNNGAEDGLLLEVLDPFVADIIRNHPKCSPLLMPAVEEGVFRIEKVYRGRIKQLLIKMDYPVVDLVGYTEGDSLSVALRQHTSAGAPFNIRDYQEEAAELFHQGGSAKGGNGVIVLPCGAGKTIVGIGILAKLRTQTLILVTSVAAVHQWIREILDKTELTEKEVGEYTGDKKNILPITVATYHVLTHRKKKDQAFTHFDLFNNRAWGLVIYDEVHLLPAPLFSVTAEIQSRRRLGLTATLVREDGKEDEVFCLIGPKRYDVPWKNLESRGWIAEALCREVRVPLDSSKKTLYAQADLKIKYRVAATNPTKDEIVERLINRHPGDSILVIGQYLDQLHNLSALLKAPLITGQTPNKKREQIYQDFREGRMHVLVVSKVANFSIDLPEAKILIQVSGMFGSRQEEAQRLGRILRPKSGRAPAHFYSVVTSDTLEQHFTQHRQLFLTEQGYRYEIEDALPSPEPTPCPA